MGEVADISPGLGRPSSRAPADVLEDHDRDQSAAAFDTAVPLEAIVFRPRKWISAEGAPSSTDQPPEVVDEVLLAQTSADGIDGTQRRYWVAPPQDNLSFADEYVVAQDPALTPRQTAADGVCEEMQVSSLGDLSLPVLGAPPAMLGTALAGGAALAGMSLFNGAGGEWTVQGSPENGVRSLPEIESWHEAQVATDPQPGFRESRLVASRSGHQFKPPATEHVKRSSSADGRRSEHAAPASRARRDASPKTTSRTGTPRTTTRSRSATPSGAPKRAPMAGSHASTSSRGGAVLANGTNSAAERRRMQRTPVEARSATARGQSPSRHHEAENVQLRAEVTELRAELKTVIKELTARTEDLREVYSLLTVRQQSRSSASNIGDAMNKTRGPQLSGLCAEAIVNRSSIIARLEADNEMYRAKVAEQDRMLLELHSEMQAQTREVQNLVSLQNCVHVMPSEAEQAARARAQIVTPRGAVGAGGTTPRGAFRTHIGGSLGLSAASAPAASPRVDARLLR